MKHKNAAQQGDVVGVVVSNASPTHHTPPHPPVLFACTTLALTLCTSFPEAGGGARARSYSHGVAQAAAARLGRGFAVARAVLRGPAVRRHDVNECQRSVLGRACRPRRKPDGARQNSEEARPSPPSQPVGATRRAPSRRRDAQLTLSRSPVRHRIAGHGCRRMGGELGTGEFRKVAVDGRRQTPRA